MFDAFDLPFARDALWVLLLLSVAGGVLGTWIVLRGLAFYSHAVGTAAFPGLVLADGIGFAAPLGAFGAAGALALAVALLTRARKTSTDSATAIALVGALALGIILASDVYESGANVETLLFGSLLVVDGGDIRLAAVAAVVTLVLAFTVAPRWLARGFDPESARGLGSAGRALDAALLAAVAFTAVAALTVVGALLATALLVIPAATTRLWFHRLLPWQIATVALTALTGAAGVWLSVETNAPPGATIAVLAGGLFALSAIARTLVARAAGRGRSVALAGASLVALLLIAGCGSDDGGGADGKLAVVATTTQIGDFTREVGGDRVDVTQLLEPNTDPHDYEPRPDDVRRTARAKVVFASGFGLDGWIGDVVEQAGGDGEIVDLGEHVPIHREGDASHSHGDEEHAGEDEHAGEEESGHEESVDPHWWHDPRNAVAAVEEIRDELATADPDGAAVYRRNADAYIAKITALDDGIGRCIDTVEPGRRKLVTDHDAFGYLTGRYGIRVIGAVIPSQTTQAQPNARDVSDLVALIRAEDVDAIFPEHSLSPKLADAIARETGITSEYQLYSDALGPADSDGATYLTMEQANADALVRGFTGGETGCAIEGIG